MLDWLRARCAEFGFDVAGVFRRHGDHDWPFDAADSDDLEAELLADGHLLPLRKEPAARANILEVAIVDHLLDRVADDPEVEATRGWERGYPDLEARRKPSCIQAQLGNSAPPQLAEAVIRACRRSRVARRPAGQLRLV